jgi:hypothetical protein
VNGMAIKKVAVDKEFNCFKNTYVGEKKFDIKTIADEDTYPMLAPLHLLKINDEKRYEKCTLSKADMGKLVDIKNGAQEKAFELHSDDNALYLRVKCSDNKRGHRYVDIKVSDVIYQIAQAASPEEWKGVRNQLYKMG